MTQQNKVEAKEIQGLQNIIDYCNSRLNTYPFASKLLTKEFEREILLAQRKLKKLVSSPSPDKRYR